MLDRDEITQEQIKESELIMKKIQPDFEHWFIYTNWFFVYNKDNKLIGNICLDKDDEYDYYSITNVCVDKEFHRQGIGTYMMTEFNKWCIKQGIDSVDLDTDINNIAAIGLYKKVGFNI